MEEYITIGEIGKPFGVRGEVRVVPYTDFPERFLSTRRLFLYQNQQLVERGVERASVVEGRVIIKLQGIDTPEEARKFRGALLQVPPGEVVPLPEGSYYYYQIVGLPVYTLEGRLLGRVEEILNTGGNDVYLVRDAQTGKEILLPAIKAVIKEINLEKGRLLVEAIPGLLEE